MVAKEESDKDPEMQYSEHEHCKTQSNDPRRSKWYWVPGFTTFEALSSVYGIRFLIAISLCSHWCKGFGRAHCGQSLRYLFQSPWSVSGPTIDVYTSIVELAWSMKPIIAISSDMFPIYGFRKIPYIMITLILGLIGCSVAAFSNPSHGIPVEIPVVGLFLTNFGWMTADILIEGLYARRMASHPETGPLLIVFITIGQQICILFSSLLSGLVIEYMHGLVGLSGAQWNLLFCLLPSGITMLPVCFNYIGDKEVSRIDSVNTRSEILKNQYPTVVLSILLGTASVTFGAINLAFSSPSVTFGLSLAIFVISISLIYGYFISLIGKIIIFLAIAAITNLSITGPAHYFYTDPVEAFPAGPHFEPWFLVTVCGIVGAIGCIIGSIIFSKFKKAKYTSIYIILTIVNAFISAPNSVLFSRVNVTWGISDYVFVGTDTAVQSAMNMLLFMPGFLLLSRVCPEGTESSIFAILASSTNFAMNIALPIGAFICSDFFGITPDGSSNETEKFNNMWIANLVMCGIKLVPLAFALYLLPKLAMTDPLISRGVEIFRKKIFRT